MREEDFNFEDFKNVLMFPIIDVIEKVVRLIMIFSFGVLGAIGTLQVIKTMPIHATEKCGNVSSIK